MLKLLRSISQLPPLHCRLANLRVLVYPVRMRAKGGSQVPTEPDSNSMSPSQITILLADDQELWRTTVRCFLVRNPELQIISEANDGEDAVRKASEVLPQVVLLDVSMPRMNGIEAAKTIRKRFPNMIFIFLTQIADPDVKIAALANADAYVLKTQAPTELAATIRRTVRIHKGVAVAAQA